MSCAHTQRSRRSSRRFFHPIQARALWAPFVRRCKLFARRATTTAFRSIAKSTLDRPNAFSRNNPFVLVSNKRPSTSCSARYWT